MCGGSSARNIPVILLLMIVSRGIVRVIWLLLMEFILEAEEQNDTVASSNAHELDREARVHPVRDCYFLLMVQQLADGTHTAQAGIFSDNVLHLPASDYRRQIGEHSRQPEQLRWGGIGGFGVHRARDGRDRGTIGYVDSIYTHSDVSTLPPPYSENL